MTDEWKKASCHGKEPFDSKSKARSAQHSQTRRRKPAVEVYKCQFCGAFHIGAPMPKIKKELRAI